MKRLLRFTFSILLLSSVAFPARAAFTSLYAFGDGICTTTNNPLAGPDYYGLRRSNGRVWIEVLAQRQGVPYDSNKNWSYYGHYSANLVANVNAFSPPADAGTALFIIWVNDADFVDNMGRIYPSLDPAAWNNAINLSLTNHLRAVTNLYAKGARTLILPNAVDITKIPQYNFIASASDKSFIRQRVIDFNTAFATTLLNQIKANCPGLTVYLPDIFALTDNVLANASQFGLVNALYNGQSIDVLEDPALADKSLNGPGASYIFWDATNPTAKFHAVIADCVQQLVSPARIANVTPLGATNQLSVTNLPVGLNGFVDGSTNFVNWTSGVGFSSTNAAQTILVPASGLREFYRLRFPFAWSWP